MSLIEQAAKRLEELRRAGADLTEVTPLKAAIPEFVVRPDVEAAARIRRILERVRAFALVRGVRGVEQTPETAFVLAAALRAYPQARAVHVVRDGRDVVCSLLERGWLSAGRTGGTVRMRSRVRTGPIKFSRDQDSCRLHL